MRLHCLVLRTHIPIPHSRTSSSHVDCSLVYVLTLSLGPSFFCFRFPVDHTRYACTTILLASCRSHLTLTLMSTLRPMSCIPSCTCVPSSDQVPIVSFSTVRSFVPLRDVPKKYIIPPWVFVVVFSRFSVVLGGIILIYGVRICKVAISIVQYT
jgi:hypothetical protein